MNQTPRDSETTGIPGRVYRSAKRVFDCKRSDNGEMVEARALAVLLKEEHIVVGDHVELEEISSGQGKNEYQIVSVAPRVNEITRFLPREGKKKVVAANCDIFALEVSVSRPEYKRGLVDRYLARAFKWQIPPLVIFNKIDEFDPREINLKFEADRLKDIGVKCFEISALDPTVRPKVLANGFSELKAIIQGKTAILLGQSGVGKSKTITALSGGKANLLSQELGKVGKGAHTTTWSELVDCDAFSVIDSPGIRSFSLEDMNQDELLSYFPDLEQLATACKFSNCAHEQDSKGCVFWSENLGNGDTYQQELIHSRLDSYKKILEEISQTPTWKKPKF